VRPWGLPTQDIATAQKEISMAEREQPKQPTHRAYSVIRREGQDDFWLNLGLVFPHKDGGGFNIMLQAFPLDGKIVCREITAEAEAEDAAPSVSRVRNNNTGRNAPNGRR
jgi:hypothetical protein